MSPTERLKTVSLLALALLVAYLVFRLEVLLWLAAALCLGNAFDSRPTAYVAALWMRFARTLGAFNSRLILSALFFLVLTPIAMIYRLLNREKVDHFLRNRRDTYFEDVDKTYRPGDFEKLW
ncbi:MAG TPA: SxtJ family membrane protein [Syntrophales bacterium]|nr:SxtJ family membrane protein [Syntrophales bacterium]HOM08425.1 SxtJ family membrane protein [Syntrophales bacterium]HOO01018.1 SxtJ family membrane protein [Syntrophales bacterium]HPC02102.1 SxtJ family membrane protein [Syntrophales bacterium]HPQ07575.1 SxtJ family membrane protein [Syntrophales bacterium]